MSEPTLAELQTWMKWAFTDPRGLSEALDGAPFPRTIPAALFQEPGPRQIEAIADPATRVERLTIYAEAYYSRLLEAMSIDFPAVRKLLETCPEGDRFRGVVAEYLAHHPSRSPNIVDLGRSFPGFLATHELNGRFPFLAELATVEWLMLEAFYAESVPPIDAAALAAIPPERWPEATFELDPSVRAFEARGPIDALWRALVSAEGDGVPDFEERPGLLLVFREGADCRAQFLEADQRGVFEGLRQGRSLGDVFDSLTADAPVMEWFSEWIRCGVIRKVNA